MNKRIKKKHNRKILTRCIINLKNTWNTNTPHWKRIKASGRKRKMHYVIPCTYAPNRNHRVYSPSLVQKALKEYINEQKDSKKALQVTYNDVSITNGAME